VDSVVFIRCLLAVPMSWLAGLIGQFAVLNADGVDLMWVEGGCTEPVQMPSMWGIIALPGIAVMATLVLLATAGRDPRPSGS
jgi:hypothetical protein